MRKTTFRLAANTTNRQLRLHIKGLEAQIASLKADAEASETMAEKWRLHAERIQQLAAEGKDPLSGEEPEFWLLYRPEDPVAGHRVFECRMPSLSAARRCAETNAKALIGQRYYVLPAFDYAICEVSPVTWKRKSAEKDSERDNEFPF